MTFDRQVKWMWRDSRTTHSLDDFKGIVHTLIDEAEEATAACAGAHFIKVNKRREVYPQEEVVVDIETVGRSHILLLYLTDEESVHVFYQKSFCDESN